MKKTIIACIYMILNLINGKVYIGQTCDFNHRTIVHKSSMNNGRRCSPLLLNAWKKYGVENFEFIILKEILPNENMDEWEEYYIDLYKSNDKKFGYNIRKVATSNFGIKFGPQSKEHVEKRTKAMLETRKKNNSTARGERSAQYGRFYTLEERISMSASGMPGTKFDKRRNKWVARIYIKDKEVYLGYFNSQEEAFECYKNKYYELEKEFLEKQNKSVLE